MVANIEENVIFRKDTMNAHGYGSDLRQRTLRVESEELILHHQQEMCAQTEDH